MKSISEEYKRECSHGKMCHWKECPECREYAIRKSFNEEIQHDIKEERKRILNEITDKKEKGYEPQTIIDDLEEKLTVISMLNQEK